MKMIISAGGTGGHIYPALAIIKKFQEMDKDFEVLYIGTHNRMENKIVPTYNIPFESLEIYGLSKNLIKNFKNVKCIFNAYQKSKRIMNEFKPDMVIGVGGYVTLPVILAAKKLKIKSFLHEQNSIPGKTNKYLSKKVDVVFTSFKESSKYFDKSVKTVFSGNPASDNVNNMKPLKKESLGFNKNKKLIVVTSGSLGSSALNQKLTAFLQMSKKSDYEVLFLTGERNYEQFKAENKFSDNIKILPYLDNLASLFKSSDLVISRAGAGTTSEIIRAEVPSILVPSPNVANNHQYYNAVDLEKNNLAIMIEEDKLDGKILYERVNELLKDDNREYKKLKNSLSKLDKTSSSDKIYKEIMEVIK